ncbi:MAG: biopolymer transporter ExbD [Saprospiraceae bacterium]|nr:biopolymer transporter ExbD [Saprospiraceae bacterium]
MAELNIANKNMGNKVRTKKLSTRVDLTAMVDLGFLLITFFMLATTFSRPHAMEIVEPLDTPNAPEYAAEKTLTILVGDNDIPYYYVATENELETKVDSTDFSNMGLREVIHERQAAVKERYGDANQLFVLIKPMPKADYRNVVNALDEMAITNVKKYALSHDFNLADSLAVRNVGLWF